jgi:hypothetical protein
MNWYDRSIDKKTDKDLVRLSDKLDSLVQKERDAHAKTLRKLRFMTKCLKWQIYEKQRLQDYITHMSSNDNP